MREISESSIFHGSWFSHDLGLLANSRYELAGKLVAWSILHRGSGPRCLSSVDYDLQQSVQHGGKIAESGYPKIYRCNLSNESEMIESLLKQHFVYEVLAEVSQFFNGLNSIGQLGDRILQNKQLFDLTLGNQHPSLTKSSFMTLYKINRSEEESNQSSKED
ncbi:Hypothetical predicted protein, partial [Paramuricea clavata]